MSKQIKATDVFESEDIFKGIRESAEQAIATLGKFKKELAGTAEDLKKTIGGASMADTKGINELIAATTKANDVKEKTIKIDQEQEKLRRLAAQAEKEEIRVKKEMLTLAEKEQKAKDKEIRQAQQQESIYAQQSKRLNDLRKSYKDLAFQNKENTAEAQKLLAEITDLDAKLKKVDATVGQHQRNVGNYEGATMSLRTELRKLTQELANMDEADPRFNQMAQRAGELRDRMQDTQGVIQATAGTAVENLAGSVANAGQIGVAAFQGMESAMVLMGIESENVMKAMLRLQALAGLGDALRTLGGLGDTLTQIRAGFVAAAQKLGILTVATETQTAATVGYEAATEGADAATTGLGRSMKALPIIAIIAAVAGLVAMIYDYVTSSNEAAAATKKREEAEKKANEEAKKAREHIAAESKEYIGLILRLKSTNEGSKERTKLMNQINSQYGTTLKNIKDETAFQAQLNKAVADYLAYQKQKFMLARFDDALQRNYEKQLKLETDIYNRRKELEKDRQFRIKLGISMGLSQAEATREADEQLKNTDATLVKLYKELDEAKKRADGYGIAMQNLSTETEDKYIPNTQKSTKETKELNTQMEKSNEYLTKQNELLNELDKYNADKRIADLNDEIKKLTQEALFTAEAGYSPDTTLIQSKIQERLELEKRAIQERLEYDKQAIEERYKADSEAAKQEIKDNYQKLIGQDGLTEEQRKKINEQYKAQFKQFHLDELQRNADKQLEIQLLTQKSNDQINELNKKAGEETVQIKNDVNDELIESEERRLEREKQLEEKAQETLKSQLEKRNEWAKYTADYFVQQSNRKIEQIDKEIAAAEEQQNILQELAANGNINAQQSLAEQQRIIDDANRRKEQEQRRQQMIELVSGVYQTYNNKLAEGAEHPLMETIRDTVMLQQFANTLLGQMPAFLEGTEDTGTNGYGVDGKGGFHAILHPNERVVPKSLNEQIGSMSNEQLARIAQEYQNGKLIRGNNAGSAMDLALLANKLDALTDTIKQKPETNIELGEITTSVMEIVKKTKQGNTLKTNRYRIRK